MKLTKFILAMSLSMASMASTTNLMAYDFKVDDIYYNITDKVNYNVGVTYKTQSAPGSYSGDIIIPETVEYNGTIYNVTSIEQSAFRYSTSLTSVVVPNSILNIKGAFDYCKALRTVKLGENVASLGSFCFFECTSLREVTLGNKIASIPYCCFYKCTALSQITLPKSLSSIEENAFSNCTSLFEITIPENVETIEKNAFIGCTALYKVTLIDSQKILSLGDNDTFLDCPISEAYIGRNFNKRLFYNKASLVDVTFGKNVTSIPEYCFSSCTNLKYIKGDLNIKTIERNAFSGCTSLLNDDINKLLKSVETLGNQSFWSCSSLKNIILPAIVELGESAFGSSSKSILETVYLGDRVKTIGRSCFASLGNLENVYIGNQISEISNYAFRGCKNLKYIYLCSDNLNTLGTDAIPTTVSRIFVPNTARYENLLKDYYLDNLITLNPSTSEYSGKAPAFSYNNNVEGAEISFDSPELNINAGEYQTGIPVTFTIGDWSSTIKVNGSYTITPATLNVIAKDVTRKYGEDNPPLECSFFGFKNGETESVLTKKPVTETTATKSSNAGTYPIIPYGAEAQNYTFNYERGTLTIAKANQTITWNQSFDNVTVGDVMELTAQSSAGLQIKYTATDEGIADIYTQNGKRYVEFMKPGTVSIRANQDGNENYNEADRVSKSVTVNAKSVPVTGITLNQTSLTLNVDESYKLVATINPADATSQLVTWSSDNESVATVGDDGRVYAIAPGIATISAECGGQKAICLVTVKSPNLSSINLDKREIEIDITDGNVSLNATYSPDNAEVPKLQWISSNEDVVKVESIGNLQAKVIPVSAGIATITVYVASNPAINDVCKVSVTDKNPPIIPVTGIVLKPASLTLTPNDRYLLIATITPEDASMKKIEWTSDNENVATVDDNGQVYAVAAGTAIITAKCGDVKAICEVTVKTPDLSGISLEKNVAEIDVSDDALILYVTHSPLEADKPQLYWTSNNEKVVKVEEIGEMLAKVKPIAAGNATITVQVMTNAAMKDICEITVTDKQSFIEELMTDENDFNVDVYNISGILIKAQANKMYLENLSTGLYIINGKKVFITNF